MFHLLESVLHVRDAFPYGLYKVIVSSNLTCDYRELVPFVAFQNAEHGCRLMFQ